MTILLPSKKQNATHEAVLPLVPLRNVVPFPYADIQLIFGRKRSTDALLSAFEGNKIIMVTAQKDPRIDEPEKTDFYSVGVICRIEHVVRIDGTIHAVIKGIKRAKIVSFVSKNPYWRVKAEPIETTNKDNKENKVLLDHLIRVLKKAFNLGKTLDPSVLVRFNEGMAPEELADQVAFSLDMPLSEKQELLEIISLTKRLKKVGECLVHEINVLKLDKSIEKKTKAKFDQQMKRAVLEQRKKEINRQLKKMGVVPAEDENIKELREKIKKAKMPKSVEKKAKRELKRLSKMNPMSPEVSYIRTYLEWLVDMPWSKRSRVKIDLKNSKKTLDDDHYGLDKVKDRVLENLSVMKLRKDRFERSKKKNLNSTANILCFIGPPGVGKTSIGRSIAKALNRKFVRVSLGGIRDEAEIRGHRRTYVGALPGRIIQGIKNAKTKNPVFMLDEIDKMGKDFRGDPASALLEVLDPEQNKEFSDHYLEVPFDLSEVFFILTGNVTNTIPGPLLDRLEVIRFSGYTDDEKLHIAKRYLVKKQLEKNGLTTKDLRFSDQVLSEIITRYTREAGVRGLERKIAEVCRKVAKRIAEGKGIKSDISVKMLHALLGPQEFSHQIKGRKDEIGTSTGLAWTQAGGEILFVEAAQMPGKGKIDLTGKLGDVMKESCHAAMSYVRSHWQDLGIKDKNFFAKSDFHIHVPEGAVPKDGPSAGVAITTALVSVLTNKKVKKDVGMTGEITLRGDVLPIGGIKEKVIAAHRAGLKKVILPKENKKDLVEIPKKVRDDMEFIFADQLSTVLENAIID